jgi:hypothetical protein
MPGAGGVRDREGIDQVLRAIKERVEWQVVKRLVGNDDQPPSCDLIGTLGAEAQSRKVSENVSAIM